mgnify:CR=1 FL=1
MAFFRTALYESTTYGVWCRTRVEALSAGAVAVLAKPKLGLKQHLEDSRREMVQTLKAAAPEFDTKPQISAIFGAPSQ